MSDNPIYILGDVHGEWPTMLYMIKSRWRLKDCTIIQVGDFGAGFDGSRTHTRNFYGAMNQKLKRLNVTLLVIRGNHDNPEHFKGQYVFSHLRLLPDYTFSRIGRIDFLFVGGAISVDREWRLKKERRKNRSRYWYWPDEPLVFDRERVRKCDVLITHSAPPWVGPVDKRGIAEFCDHDDSLWEDCSEERENVERIIKLAKPVKAFGGHFHEYFNHRHEGCEFSIIPIMEIKELRM